VTIATNMAGRGTDIKLGGNPEFRARKKAGTDATPEEYRKVHEAELEKWQSDYDEVRSAGGLFVLGTERHESRRIDNQLRGRSGRQGDPGTSRFFISLDDELMRLFGENLKNLMQRFGFKPGEVIYHPWISKTIEKAQKRVEDRNFEIRKHLLEFDDVLNEQRNFIYTKRNEILSDSQISDRIVETALEIASNMADEYLEKKDKSGVAIKRLLEQLFEEFFYIPDIPAEEFAAKTESQLREYLSQAFRNEMEEKAKLIGHEYLNAFLRQEYINCIDSKWLDHLSALDALKEAVYLRAYSQKNPLTEYKLEGFQIFDEMLVAIRTEIAHKAMRVKIRTAPEHPHSAHGGGKPAMVASHAGMDQFAGVQARQPRQQASVLQSQPQARPGPGENQQIQVKRNEPKVGRNDPCPCGSGKKYKKCHGS
ncbi:MAG: preprotein translocase subunit SecA, partial [Spirochaetaceae bacterium]